MTRERDAAVAQVAHVKADKARVAQELKVVVDSKTTEVNQMTFKYRYFYLSPHLSM